MRISTAWVYGVTAERAWLLAKFPPRRRTRSGGESRRAVTSQINPDGKAVAQPGGGWRVSGHWHFVSGVDIADWSVFCAMAPAGATGEPPTPLYVLVPKSDWQVIDNWHVAGLAATGSRDVRLDDVFVPAHRTVRMLELKAGGGPGLEVNPAPLFRLPLIAVNPYAILAPLLGIAEGALEQTIAGAKARRLVTTGAAAADQQVVQLRIAEAAAEIDAARALILGDCREAQAAVERGEAVSTDLRIRLRRNQGFATRLLIAAVDRLFVVAGGRGIYLRSRHAARVPRHPCGRRAPRPLVGPGRHDVGPARARPAALQRGVLRPPWLPLRQSRCPSSRRQWRRRRPGERPTTRPARTRRAPTPGTWSRC